MNNSVLSGNVLVSQKKQILLTAIHWNNCSASSLILRVSWLLIRYFFDRSGRLWLIRMEIHKNAHITVTCGRLLIQEDGDSIEALQFITFSLADCISIFMSSWMEVCGLSSISNGSSNCY